MQNKNNDQTRNSSVVQCSCLIAWIFSLGLTIQKNGKFCVYENKMFRPLTIKQKGRNSRTLATGYSKFKKKRSTPENIHSFFMYYMTVTKSNINFMGLTHVKS